MPKLDQPFYDPIRLIDSFNQPYRIVNLLTLQFRRDRLPTPLNMTQKKKTILALVILIAAVAFIYLKFGQPGPSPVATTISRLNALETTVIDWSKTNGKIPASLADLDLPEEQTNDHKGEPFIFSAEGRAITISSLGADGKTGGNMFNADQKVEFNIPE